MKRAFPTGLVVTLVLACVLTLASSSHAQECTEPQTPVSEIEVLGKAEAALRSVSTQHFADLNTVFKTRHQLQCLLKRNPETVFRERVDADLYQVQEIIAEHNLKIAGFYMQRYRSIGHGVKGAEARLLEIIRVHPRFSKMDEVLLNLGTVASIGERPDEAETYFRQVVSGYPKSSNCPLAVAKLAELGFDSKQKCSSLKQ